MRRVADDLDRPKECKRMFAYKLCARLRELVRASLLAEISRSAASFSGSAERIAASKAGINSSLSIATHSL